MAITDITIYGAGIFGLSIAWACVQRGAKVVVVDPQGPGGGASGGLVGALAPHVPELWNEKKQFQLESLLMATDFWAEVEAAAGMTSSYSRSGRIQPLENDRGVGLAHARIDGAKKLWHGHAIWQVLDTNPHPQWVPKSATGYWVYDSLSARMSPRVAATALAQAIIAKGGIITHAAPPKGVVIWATGVAGLTDLSHILGQKVGDGEKGQSALLDYDARDLPQVFSGGVHFIPHADGRTAIGSTTEREFSAGDTTDALLEDLIARARQICPALKDAKILERWASLRPRSRTRAPMLGAWPQRKGHFVANGGFKIGFGMAPKVAKVMADLVLEDINNIPNDLRLEANLVP